jgi:hypothetical protein
LPVAPKILLPNKLELPSFLRVIAVPFAAILIELPVKKFHVPAASLKELVILSFVKPFPSINDVSLPTKSILLEASSKL